MDLLRCPQCYGFLRREEGRLACDPCRRGYAVRDGIVCFNETDEYFGELEPAEMQEFLGLAQSRGWETAVREYLPQHNAGLVRTITDPRRTAWASVLPLRGDEIVLDFGCGLGGVAVPLAAKVRHVVGLDGCFDRIRFLQVRRTQDHIENLTLVCNGTAHRLPFADGGFDLIVLNMVFPYLAGSLPEHPLASAERIILAEIVRTLRPGGLLYFAVRNRYSLHHIRKRLLSFGRKMGDEMTAPHSFGAWRRLLETCGLDEVRAYWPIPDYKCPDHMVRLTPALDGATPELDRVAPSFPASKRVLASLAHRMGKLHHLADTVSYVARRSRTA